MGIDSGITTFYRAKDVTLNDVRKAGVYLRSKATSTSNPVPVALVDCNYIANKLGRSSDPSKKVFDFLTILKNHGFHVMPVCDPHNTRSNNIKRIGQKRTKESLMNKVNYSYNLIQLQSLRNNSQSQTLTEEETAELTSIQKKIASYEKNNNQFRLQNTFVEDIQAHLTSSSSHIANLYGGFIQPVVIAAFQADSLIAKTMQSSRGDGSIIFTSDSDYFYLSGLTNCLQVTTFKINAENKTCHCIQIASPVKEVFDQCINVINESPIQIVTTKLYPILDIVGSKYATPLTRGYLAITLGCDVYPGGIKNTGPAALYKHLQRVSFKDNPTDDDINNFEDCLLQWMVSINDCNGEIDIVKLKEMYRTFALAFIAEPCLPKPDYEEGKTDYLCNSNIFPPSPSEYLKPYIKASNQEDISYVNDVIYCKGVVESHHIHKYEYTKKCDGCKELLCMTCFINGDNNRYWCFNCWQDMKSLPDKETLSMEKMLEELIKVGKEVNKPYSYLDIVEAYELYVNSDYLSYARKSNNEVIGSLMSPIAYNTNHRVIERIDFKCGGRFISSKNITDIMVPKIISIFASLVTFSSNDINLPKYNDQLFSCFPNVMIKFANDSRTSELSYRILERTLRHSMDSRHTDWESMNGYLVELNDGDIALHLNTSVHASMRKEMYNVNSCCSTERIVMTSCECKIGADLESDDMDQCVHFLTPFYDLLRGLCDGLAEHFLFELKARRGGNNALYDESTMQKMVHDIKQLCIAAGVDTEKIKSNNLLDDILHEFFAVTTERDKAHGKRKKRILNPKLIGPIRNLNFTSNKKLAQECTNCLGVQNSKKRKVEKLDEVEEDAQVYIIDTAEENIAILDTIVEDIVIHTPAKEEAIVPPDYVASYILAKAAGINVEEEVKRSRIIGLQLFKYRADKIIKSKSQRWIKSQMDTYKEMWKDLHESLNHRDVQVARPNAGRKKKTNEEMIVNQHVSSPVAKKQNTKSNKKKADKQVTKKKPRNRKSDGSYYSVICKFHGCKYHNKNYPMKKFSTFPTGYTAETIRGLSLKRQKSAVHRNKIRTELLDRCVGSRVDDLKKKYLCSEHPMEEREVHLNLGKYGKPDVKWKVCIQIPRAVGPQSSLSKSVTPCKGVGNDRAMSHTLEELSAEKGKEGGTGYGLLVQQLAERNDDSCIYKRPMSDYNAHLLEFTPQQNILWDVNEVRKNTSRSRRRILVDEENTNDMKGSKDKPRVSFDISDSEVRRRTNFATRNQLLLMIIILCNGDPEVVGQSYSKMTWFEQWFFFFEYIWGRTINRWIDAASENHYDSSERRMSEVYQKELDQVLKTRLSWPMFCTYEEDTFLSKEFWKKEFKGKRVVFWDHTNIPIKTPSNAELQTATWSSYYAMNCAKGAVFIQPCGWMGTYNLWSGAVSDTDYMISSEILKMQHDFAMNDIVNGEYLPFILCLDKGYRITLACMRMGKQMTLQPDFAKSDRKFNSEQTLSSASVASTRSGNERAVRYSKQSGLVRRGKYNSSSAKVLDDSWLAWGFLANFMFSAVH